MQIKINEWNFKLRDMKVLLYWTVIEVGMGQATKKKWMVPRVAKQSQQVSRLDVGSLFKISNLCYNAGQKVAMLTARNRKKYVNFPGKRPQTVTVCSV